MTPDGISEEDWDKMTELADSLANAVMASNTVHEKKYRRELLAWLDQLQQKYGELPSILATMADYVEKTSDQLTLLQKAFLLAQEREDMQNSTLIASSITQIYVEELGDMENGKAWLGQLGQCLEAYPDDFEQDEYNRLSRMIKD